MPLDSGELSRAVGAAAGEAGDLHIHTQLCRAQLANFEHALATGEPLLVACTQEAPLFAELAEEEHPESDLRFANIRENAGWGEEGEKSAPKIAALLAAATEDARPTPLISLKSEGVCLVYGKDERALEVAQQLKSRLDVTVLLREAADIIPPRVMDVPVFQGRIVAAKGHLGAFGITVNGYAAAFPSSRQSLQFDLPRNGAFSECDIILDLTGDAPLFPAGERRDGYLRPDPDDPIAVQKAALAATDLVGEFEKPIYIRYDEEICAHGRSRKTGCSACVDNCPVSAITSLGEIVELDPHICGGCGLCAALCPTGAIEYQLPAGSTLLNQVRTLLETYRKAGGERPLLLLHDERHGTEMISMMSRFGRGLPARVLPVLVNEVTELGFDFYFDALAWGAAQVALLVAPDKREEVQALAGTLGLVESVMDGLGYGGGRVHLLDQQDPDAVEEALWSMPAAPGAEGGSFLPMGGKRARAFLGLHHLHDKAPQPIDILPLPQGAPFGTVHIDTSGCTMCQACV
ncbi:MAG TPA: 4Fe-4S dicluster domain-containing protein, partial [Kiloniellales bacterium]|nr:4Fe-4S dicluster domain-containing protein [Kiloniellales bacterium]